MPTKASEILSEPEIKADQGLLSGKEKPIHELDAPS